MQHQRQQRRCNLGIPRAPRPAQGDDVRGDAWWGLCRARAPGTSLLPVASKCPMRSRPCHSASTCASTDLPQEWHAANHTCCALRTTAPRVSCAGHPRAPNVVVSGRRPSGGRVLGPGPVLDGCQVLDTVPGASSVTQCDAATSNADGLRWDPMDAGGWIACSTHRCQALAPKRRRCAAASPPRGETGDARPAGVRRV